MKKYAVLASLSLLLGFGACTPKVGTLRSPEYKGDVGAGKSDTNTGSSASRHETVDSKHSGKGRFASSNIALVLPFQLDQIATTSIAERDIKRSALALDFYQGFQMGLEELSKKGKDFYLNVLDSRDDDFQNATLAKSSDVKEASLIIGPVYPKEIKSFGASLVEKDVLQINPLAASMPTEFNLPNLVSLTPAIKSHTNAIANEVARNYSSGDAIIIYTTSDSDGRQFLNGMSAAIKQAKSNVDIVTVSNLAQLDENLVTSGYNHIVTGTTDKQQIKALLGNLSAKHNEESYMVQLYGHPLWDRFDWSIYTDFSNLSPRITSESTLKNWSAPVKSFRDLYAKTYGVKASDHAIKGYDCAIFFGNMLNKYGVEKLKENLTKESYDGLYSRYKFNFNDTWGYTNEAVSIRVYRGTEFQLQ